MHIYMYIRIYEYKDTYMQHASYFRHRIVSQEESYLVSHTNDVGIDDTRRVKHNKADRIDRPKCPNSFNVIISYLDN